MVIIKGPMLEASINEDQWRSSNHYNEQKACFNCHYCYGNGKNTICSLAQQQCKKEVIVVYNGICDKWKKA